MAQFAIISDIHGNAHALRAVLARIRRMGIRDIVCLGDIVGYGPSPGECIDLVMNRCRQVIRGNHEDAVGNARAGLTFNATARQAIEWTRAILGPWHFDVLRMLPEYAYIGDEVMCVHASPVTGAATDYVSDARVAAGAFAGVDRRACLIGHTHVPMIFEAQSSGELRDVHFDEVASYLMQDGHALSLAPERRYLCNPGSVGQPRDGDPRASFAVLDTKRWSFTLHREMYDIDAARAESERAGLPLVLGDRLAVGA